MLTSDLILFTTDDGQSRIQMWASDGVVWLSQLEITDLFSSSKQNVAKHLKIIFDDQEFDEVSVVNQWLTTTLDGKS